MNHSVMVSLRCGLVNYLTVIKVFLVRTCYHKQYFVCFCVKFVKFT